MASGSGEQSDDLSRPRVAVRLRLLEHGRAVAQHLEAPACGRDQFDLGVGKLRADLGRQTDGPRLVVSKGAVFDADLHVALRVRGGKLTRRKGQTCKRRQSADDGVLSRDYRAKRVDLALQE